MANIDKIERRVRGLLAQAADREGTPEGDAFRARAFDLMARYGMEESNLQDTTGDEMVQRDIHLSGSYTPQQHTLAHVLANALHCHAIGTGTGRKVNVVAFFGKARHVERVTMLFTILNPHMIAGASSLTRDPFVSPQVQKRSWMGGFAQAVGDRLRAAEGTAARKAGQSVALVDDGKLARAFADKLNPHTRKLRSRAQADLGSARAGAEAAGNMDLGQQRFGGRAALPAGR